MSGRVLGDRYPVVRELGRGRLGILYLARDVELERDVVVREIGIGEARSARLFADVAARAVRLDHPNIVAIHDVVSADDGVLVVSEHVPGGSLRSWARRLTQPQLAGALEQSLGALAYAHSFQVLHLDLRPENLLVTSDGRIKVAGFGVAAAYHAARGDGSEEMASPSTDLRALGQTAYELIVGWPPFEDVAPLEILERYQVDLRLTAWIELLLAMTAPERPASAEEALSQLTETGIDGLGPSWAAEARLIRPEGWEFVPERSSSSGPLPTRPELRSRLRDLAGAGVVPKSDVAAWFESAEPVPVGAKDVFVHHSAIGSDDYVELEPGSAEPWEDGAGHAASVETPASPTGAYAPPPAPMRRSPARLWPWLVAPLLVLGAAAATAKLLLGWFVEAGTPSAPATDADADDVACTVFAPSAVPPGDSFLVQVFAHLPEEAADAKAIASELDTDAVRRGFRSLEAPVRVGSRLDFELRFEAPFDHDRLASLVWRRRTEAVQFAVRVPTNMPNGTVIATVSISLDSVPLGYIKFMLTIEPNPATHESEPQGEVARRYRYAFVSYASADRDEVLRRVQLLPLVGIEYFQDILSIEPGDRWSQRIELGIDRCDLFLLFWSSDAKQSEWVRREVRYALTRKGGSDLQPPAIQPVVVEGPPIVAPWEELADLHFNDRHLYFIRAESHARPCTACGHRNDADSTFCGHCGTYLGWQTGAPEPAS